MFNNDNLTLYLKDLENLVNIDTPHDNHKGIIKSFDYIVKNIINNTNLHATTHNYSPNYAPCLVVSNVKHIMEEENIDLLYISHIDTVFPVKTAKRRKFTVKGHRAFGPGVIDNKSGVLNGLYAMKLLTESNIKIALFINTNEEEGSIGSQEIVKKLAKKARFVLGLEPAREDGSIVSERIGALIYNFKVTNNKNESSEKDKNLLPSPILTMSDTLQSLNQSLKRLRSIQDAKLYINNNSTGENLNLDTLDFKLVLTVNSMKGISRSNEIINALVNKKYEDSSLTSSYKYYPPLEQSVKNKHMFYVASTSAKKYNVKLTQTTSYGGSDSTYASEMQGATLDGFGPVGGNMHKEDEYLDISSIQDRCNILISLTEKLAKTRDFSNERKARKPRKERTTKK